MKMDQTVLRRYKLVDLIGEGGQASLAKGTDQKTGQTIVIKQLSAIPGQSNYEQELARFKRSGKLPIGHPVVVDPIDFGEEKGAYYTIMPFIEGVDLGQYVSINGGKLQPQQATEIIRQVADGVGAIHDQGIVHRDIKPENILIAEDDQPHIIDLGICKNQREKTITEGTGLLGSLLWMAPEQIANPGNESPQSDLYALGAIFYFILTGNFVAQGEQATTIAMSICRHMPLMPRECDPAIPEHISQTCMRLLQKLPEHRFQSAQEFCQTLDGNSTPIPVSQFCTSCGVAVPRNSIYCCHCGMKMSGKMLNNVRCFACGAHVDSEPSCPSCHRPFGISGHRLLFNQGSLTGTSFRIPEGIYTIGRNQLSSRDQHISRRHVHVACLDGHVRVQDAGSTNKTCVAGQMAELPLLLQPDLEFYLAGNTATYITNTQRSTS